MPCRIDHITVVSPTLDAGSEWVFERLGVRPQRGGEHPRMGTHNLLLRLGDAMFLEVIAVNPDGAEPSRPRWFALDTLPRDAAPRLGCWVTRTEDIEKSLGSASTELGVAEPMARGTLEWLISIPEDGSLPLNGVAPALIQWQTVRHPALAMQDQGCSLAALELWHPEPARVERLLAELAIAEPSVKIAVAHAVAPALVAHIETPQGLRTIGAAPSFST